jgi:hypothetical protein
VHHLHARMARSAVHNCRRQYNADMLQCTSIYQTTEHCHIITDAPTESPEYPLKSVVELLVVSVMRDEVITAPRLNITSPPSHLLCYVDSNANSLIDYATKLSRCVSQCWNRCTRTHCTVAVVLPALCPNVAGPRRGCLAAIAQPCV